MLTTIETTVTIPQVALCVSVDATGEIAAYAVRRAAYAMHDA